MLDAALFPGLSSNPLDDVRNTQRMVAIWHDGREVKPRVPADATASR